MNLRVYSTKLAANCAKHSNNEFLHQKFVSKKKTRDVSLKSDEPRPRSAFRTLLCADGLCAAATPLVLAVLSSWLPQLQSCAELIQLRLSLASASSSALTAAPSFAAAAGGG